ncbi:OsmC family protein [Brevibacterium linens]|uniref:OsmC family protein n=1 Tax=Brevibacterium linens TaxID=1703 RepID=UPI003BF46F43
MTENPGYAQPQAPSGDSDEPKSPSAPIYTAKVENLGGTSGEVRVEDGQTLPTAPTSRVEEGNNPEQFLAMAWSTCLGETLKVVLAVNDIEALSRVRVEVELHNEPSGNGFYFAPKAFISIEGVSDADAEKYAARAHARCPISKLLMGKGTPVVEIEPYKNPDNFQLS